MQLADHNILPASSKRSSYTSTLSINQPHNHRSSPEQASTTHAYDLLPGTISLVRSVSADGLLIARPFSPLLFMQGKQAFPTLLMKVLRGEVPEEEVGCMIDATETEYHRLLKSGIKAALEKQTWACSGCGSIAAQHQYRRQRKSDKLEPDAYLAKHMKKGERMKAYLKHIIAPGFLRKCMECRGDGFLTCDICAESKPRSAFTESQVQNKAIPLRQLTCLDCAHPACSVKGCLTCKSCRDPDCKRKERCESNPIPLSFQAYPKNLAEKLSFQCRS